ncbi:MAG: type II toxin-antitoxin system VapC family toxin [Anaerolineae bacterium]|nr:type II toxin-antitoxin system VapC family toxin [Anaerolineae bacterium]
MGELTQALASHTIIGVDTAPFIYLWERHPRYFDLSETLFRHLQNPDVQGITSIVTLIEACVLPQRQGRLDLVQAYERALLHSQQVQMLPVDAAVARQAVALRARYDVRVPDAVQIAAALEAGATAFVTNDRRLLKVQELQVLLLDEYVT